MEITGIVKAALPLESGTSKSGKPWQKATIILEYGDEKYPKTVAISALKHAEEFRNIAVGTQVKVQIDMSSREFNGRWYTEVLCWKWEAAQPQGHAANDPYATAGLPPRQQPLEPQGQSDDLPF